MLCLEDSLPFRAYAVAETLGFVVNFGLRKPQGSRLILIKDGDASCRNRRITLLFANKCVRPLPPQAHNAPKRPLQLQGDISQQVGDRREQSDLPVSPEL